MGIDQILNCPEHLQAVTDFMSHPNIEILVKKLMAFYIENVRECVLIDMK